MVFTNFGWSLDLKLSENQKFSKQQVLKNPVTQTDNFDKNTVHQWAAMDHCGSWMSRQQA